MRLFRFSCHCSQADCLILKSVIKTARLRRWCGLTGNHDYNRKKGTQFVTIEPHSDEILIVLVAKGTHGMFLLKHHIIFYPEFLCNGPGKAEILRGFRSTK